MLRISENMELWVFFVDLFMEIKIFCGKLNILLILYHWLCIFIYWWKGLKRLNLAMTIYSTPSARERSIWRKESKISLTSSQRKTKSTMLFDKWGPVLTKDLMISGSSSPKTMNSDWRPENCMNSWVYWEIVCRKVDGKKRISTGFQSIEENLSPLSTSLVANLPPGIATKPDSLR